MPRASNAREVSSIASSRPERITPRVGASTAPTTGTNPVSATPIAVEQAERDEDERVAHRPPEARAPLGHVAAELELDRAPDALVERVADRERERR